MSAPRAPAASAAEVAGVEDLARRVDQRGVGEPGEAGAEADAGDAGGGELRAADRGERADRQHVHRHRHRGADRAHGGEVGQERHVDAVGAGLGEGPSPAQRLVEVVAAGHQPVGAGDQHEVAGQAAGGVGGGAHPLDGEREAVGARAGQVGVLDRGAAEPGLGGEPDGLGHRLGRVAVAVLEVAADRQRRRRRQRRGVGEGLVAADRAPRRAGRG